MMVYRLCKSKYAADLSGKGAEVAGGRWNSKGVAMLYTSESRALCTTEIAVHTPLGNIPNDYNIVSIEIPNSVKILELDMANLPGDWNSIPHANSTQLIGDGFITANKYLVMKVPSCVVQGDYNYLINPMHKDFYKIKITANQPFAFDERLFNRQ